MPNNLVKTKRDERLWKKAKSIVSDRYKLSEIDSDYYRLVNGIFERMRNPSKEAVVKKDIQKDKYIKIAKEIAEEHFRSKTDLNEIITKVALAENMNKNQIQNICTTTNHIVHAALMADKNVQDDKTNKYIDFEIARPEKVADEIDKLVQVPDPIYDNPDLIFHKKASDKSNEGVSYAQFVNKTVREGQIIRQNIKNIATAHYKIANDLLLESNKAEDSMDKLYGYIKEAVLAGKDITVIKTALAKVFSSMNNFDIIWSDIQAKLIADNVIQREQKDSDRVPDYLDNLIPSAASPIVSLASEIDRRMNRIDQFEKIMVSLEKMAADAKDDLFKNLILEKNAVLGTALKGIGKWTAKKIFKQLPKSLWKNKGKVVTGGWYAMDTVPAINKKITKVIGSAL